MSITHSRFTRRGVTFLKNASNVLQKAPEKKFKRGGKVHKKKGIFGSTKIHGEHSRGMEKRFSGFGGRTSWVRSA